MADFTFEAPGDSGVNAIDGESFSHIIPSMGENGLKGRDATPAGKGFKGGRITIRLSSIPNQRESGHIFIAGEIVYENRSKVMINGEYFLGTVGLINFISRGGIGGNGAKGGDGQNGGNGFPGSDATDYSNVTDGGPGGNGGDGGRGSDGGNGGDGGKVIVTVNEQDSHLLMLLGKCDLTGGNGGIPGSHGNAGRGGVGGVGGRGREEEPKGNDGPDGRDGKVSKAQLYGGRQGMNGELEYGIENFNGTYERRSDHSYRLEISEFLYETPGDCGIIEPGSSISIVNMKFVNIGLSPTPKYSLIRIELDSFGNEWIGHVTYLYAPYDILPNNVKYLDPNQRIIININDLNTVNDGLPLYHSISLRGFRAMMTQLERPLETFNVNDQVQFVIQQPINISEVIAIRSPGGLQYEVFWFVTNISKSPFGRNSNCRRMIMTRLTAGELDGVEIDSQEIQLLNGGETMQVTSRVRLDDIQPQQFTVTLQIGSIGYPDVLKSIQTRRFVIQPIPESKHLLLDVTKNACTNINHFSNVQDFNGSIYLQLSTASNNTTNIGKINVNGKIRFSNNLEISLNHYFNFEPDGYIYITQRDSPNICEVTIITTEQESYLFALLKETYEDPNNKIHWNFQTINQSYNTTNTYSTPFKLRVASYFPIIENNVQIYEPNSKGIIQGLRIFNEGEMPTPNNHNIIVKLLPTENVIPNDDIFFIISKSIAYNSTLELENSTFKFSIKNNERGFENIIPLQIRDYFSFKAVVTTIEHTLPNFNDFENQQILIQYPIQMGEYLGFRHPSATEEKYRLFWKIQNISNIEFGKNSEVGRLVESSLYKDDDDDDAVFINEVDTLTRQNNLLLTTNVVIEDKTQFHSRLQLGSPGSPEKLSPIQSYSFQLSPLLYDDVYKNLDLVLDLNAGRLTFDNIQPSDYTKPGSFQLLLSTPKTDKAGDVAIKGTLQYTNGWIVQINDSFSLDLNGWIYLYPNGKYDLVNGQIDIEIAEDDMHLLYLIDKSILQSCKDQSYKVIGDTETPDTAKKYERIYQFTLLDFDCVPEDNSGIYEPGARIVIRKIKVKNTGGMPTPTSHDVEVTINLSNSTGISLPNHNKLKLPKPIEHNNQVELNPTKEADEHYLEFQINQQDSASQDKPLDIFGTVNLKALMFGINREISSFTLPKQLNIRYPIQICPNTKIKDFPYKDLTRISWKVNNISQIDFGSTSDSKRMIKIQVKINNMTPSDSLKFKTGQTLTTFEQEITLLNANRSEEMYCELERTLSNDDPTIIEVDFSITLYLGSIESPDKGVEIEIRNKCIDVSPSYKTNKDADFLLVVNPKTKKKVVDDWKILCQQVGLKMSLWDIKREGHFDLIESGVIEDISGKSIVMLNDDLDDEDEKDFEIKQTLDYLDPFHFYQAVNTFNIKFFVAGTIIDDKRVENLFIPKMMHSSPIDQPSPSSSPIPSPGPQGQVSKIKSYLQQRGVIKHSAIMERDVVKQPIKSATIESVQTRLRPSFNLFSSGDSYKEKKLKKLSKSLQKSHPGQRHILVSVVGNDKSNDSIVLCKTASRTKQHLLYYGTDVINDPNRTNKIGLLSCIPFRRKLEKLQNLFDTNQDPDLLEIIKSLIEVDLVIELIGLSGIKEIHKEITTDILLSHMELFNTFTEFIKNSREITMAAKSIDWMFSVFAKLKILLQYSKDSLINFNSASRVKQLKTIVESECSRAFGRFTNQTNQTLPNLLENRAKYIKSNFKSKHKPANSEKLAYFKFEMTEILKANNLKSDFELFNDKLDFILSESEYKSIHENHERTSGTIKKKKTIRQNQLRSLSVQDIFKFDGKNLTSDNVEIKNAGSEVNVGQETK